MEKHGLIRREAGKEDGRVQALYLTAKGEELSANVREIVRQSRDFFHDISSEEYDQVIDLLRGIYWRVVKSGAANGARP